MSQRRYVRGEVREVITYAEGLGFSVSKMMGSGHIMLIHENGRKVTMSATPSGGRWRKNAEAQFRRVAKGMAP